MPRFRHEALLVATLAIVACKRNPTSSSPPAQTALAKATATPSSAPSAKPSPRKKSLFESMRVKQLAAGSFYTCALQDAGTVICWGSMLSAVKYESPTLVPDLDDVKQIALGTSHACALTKTGAVRCWGTNEKGQLGVPDSMESTTKPLLVTDLKDVEELAAGADFTGVRGGSLLGRQQCAAARLVRGRELEQARRGRRRLERRIDCRRVHDGMRDW